MRTFAITRFGGPRTKRRSDPHDVALGIVPS